jgi:catechol 2,3-dioxygenase-like lactoylglutathione lyase family enzyme
MVKLPTLIPELLCSDIKVSLLFYVNLLGFKIYYERPASGFAMLERQGAFLMLEEIVSGSARSWSAGQLEKPFGRGINLQIQTKYVDLLYTLVQKSEVIIFLPIEERWYQVGDTQVGNRQFIVLDPDGYLLRFFEEIQ